MSIIAWQGIQFEVPSRWSPVKLEGDFNSGYLLLADLHRPRLGVRWARLRGSATEVLRQELGELAAKEAIAFTPNDSWKSGFLYTEPSPPGRDIWVGVATHSDRSVTLSYHAHRREQILQQNLLPTLQEISEASERAWSVFDLSCRLPREYALVRQSLNAGDLRLDFRRRRDFVTVRQIAIAHLALKRRPIEQWLAAQEQEKSKQYRPMGEMEDHGLECRIARTMTRRRRFRFAWRLPETVTTIALHDEARDRIVLVQTSNVELASQALQSVGWASEAPVG